MLDEHTTVVVDLRIVVDRWHALALAYSIEWIDLPLTPFHCWNTMIMTCDVSDELIPMLSNIQPRQSA